MTLFISLVLLVVGAVLLLKGADWFMDGIGDVAKAFGISMVVLGVLLAGLEPEEMITAAIASGQGRSGLALGNVVGTNVTMVTAALGLSALLAPIIFGRSLRRQAISATLVSLLPIVLLFTGLISRLEGILLLIIFIAYTLFLLRTDRNALERREQLESLEDDDDDDDDESRFQSQGKPAKWRPLAMTLIGLIALVLGGYALVQGAEELTQTIGIGDQAIGATLVSLATGSEMIVIGIAAARKKRSEVLVGGILGSFAYNLLVTLGLAAAIHPIPVNLQQIGIALGSMIAAHLLLLGMIWRGRMGRLAGGLFLLFYVAYLIMILV